jgi:hypothetical protein
MGLRILEKVSPPFEGGVAGRSYSLNFSIHFPAGVVDLLNKIPIPGSRIFVKVR